MSRPDRKPSAPAIADPDRFRRHMRAAVEAFIAGDGNDLLGQLTHAAAAMHETPQPNPMSVVRRQTA